MENQRAASAAGLRNPRDPAGSTRVCVDFAYTYKPIAYRMFVGCVCGTRNVVGRLDATEMAPDCSSGVRRYVFFALGHLVLR